MAALEERVRGAGPAAPQGHDRARLRRSAAIRIAISVLAAAGITTLAIVAIWAPLDVKTDIVGANTFAGFNIENWVRAYYLVAAFFPVAAFLIFLGLTRLAPTLGLASPPLRGPLRPLDPAPPQSSALVAEPPVPERRWPLVRVARIGFPGAVVGIEAGIVANHGRIGLVVGTIVYAAVACGLAALLARSSWAERWSSEARLGAANALLATLALAGLVACAAVTKVTVLSTGEVHHYMWFPAWLGLPLTALAAGVVARALRRRPDSDGALAVERATLLLFAAPICLFLFSSKLWPDPPGLDIFHSGEQLVGSRLVTDGWFPWRDVVLTHGLLSDSFNPVIGHAIFGDSRWGQASGVTVWLHPLYLVSVYLLCTYLFGRNWVFMLLTGLLFAVSWLGPEHYVLADVDFRFIFWPLLLLLLAVCLRSTSWAPPAALAALSVVQTFLVPEALPAVIAVGAVIVAYEWYERRPGDRLAATYRRTVGFAVGGLAMASLLAGYLAANHALDDFWFITKQLIAEHSLAGSFPPQTAGFDIVLYYWAALAPVAALLCAFAYAVSCLRLRRRFRTEDWVMAAAALFLVVYYPKFIYRMDGGHLFQTYSIAVPLIFFVIYRVVTALESVIRERIPAIARATLHPVSLILLIVAAIFAANSVDDRVTEAPAFYRPEAPHPVKVSRIGYVSGFDYPMLRDLTRVINAYLGPNDRLYDFTNEPTLFFYFIDRFPAIRYFHASLELNAPLQRDAIKELRKARPKLIVFDDTAPIGLANWDGVPTTVRNYLMSQWILDHYRPLLTSHSHTFYVRRDQPPPSRVGLHLEEKPITHDPEFQTQSCVWGKVPNYLAGPGMPPPGAQGVGARAIAPPTAKVTEVGWAGDPKAGLPAREAVAVIDGQIVGRAKPTIDRPDVVAYGLPAGFERTGFQLAVPKRDLSKGKLKLYGVSKTGKYTELVRQGEKPEHGKARIGGRTVELTPNAVYGQLNYTIGGADLQITAPAGTTWSDYRWIEIDAGRKGFGNSSVALYDRQDRPSPQREITFQTMPGKGDRYIVPVGSCPQWHGYASRHLYLDFFPRESVSAVRLIR